MRTLTTRKASFGFSLHIHKGSVLETGKQTKANCQLSKKAEQEGRYMANLRI